MQQRECLPRCGDCPFSRREDRPGTSRGLEPSCKGRSLCRILRHHHRAGALTKALARREIKGKTVPDHDIHPPGRFARDAEMMCVNRLCRALASRHGSKQPDGRPAFVVAIDLQLQPSRPDGLSAAATSLALLGGLGDETAPPIPTTPGTSRLCSFRSSFLWPIGCSIGPVGTGRRVASEAMALRPRPSTDRGCAHQRHPPYHFEFRRQRSLRRGPNHPALAANSTADSTAAPPVELRHLPFPERRVSEHVWRRFKRLALIRSSVALFMSLQIEPSNVSHVDTRLEDAGRACRPRDARPTLGRA
ncbi:hypothetical protein PCL_12574 [Purpureocillium lilacinum]|uniref:Uncharacterized protein n=1 Tax=Purpureocillium lilacinum TaxID=33203 RepID=A0A2U3E9N2_PURLI|nr:hypothetical protein PCL_12574 [Purpureocillium lilacinum]